MSLYVSSLNSGSNGNCYYIGNDEDAILVDAGISCKEILKRMQRAALDINKVRAIFISHEHSDHIRGLTILSKKFSLPVYINKGTMQNGRLFIAHELVNDFCDASPVAIGKMVIHAFRKHHDAADPYSFVIEHHGTRVGVFTDIGRPCDSLTRHFSNCHAAFLESNYDEAMLEKSSYPWHLKNRIRGGLGHLSNKQAMELFLACRPAFMSHLFLSHLSQNNNCPELVKELFESQANGIQIVVASRHVETPVYRISAADTVRSAENIKATVPARRVPSTQLQLSL